ncbi:MAG: adenylate/guanylate cyclase domain-containing protein [Spirochaetota bacterium]
MQNKGRDSSSAKKKPEHAVFEGEYNELAAIRNFLEQKEHSQDELQERFLKFSNRYEALLKQTIKLLKIGDSTQRRLLKTQDELRSTYDELEDSYKNLKVLSKIGKTITSSLDIKEIILSVYEYIESIMRVDLLMIGLYEPNKENVKYRICVKDGEFLPAMVKDSLQEDTISKLCYESGEELVIESIDDEYPQYTERLTKQWDGKTNSLLYFPLWVEKRFIGILSAQTYEKTHFSEAILSIFRTLASYVGIAIDNAAAYRDITKKNRQLNDSIEKINQLNEGLEVEREKSEKLLLNILPVRIAERLKSGENVIADNIPDATVLFADIAGFTQMSSKIESPGKLVHILNSIFTEFDSIAENYSLEKIKTIGDCYMLAGGVPESTDNHTEKVAQASLRMIKVFYDIRDLWGIKVNLRVGLHRGSIVAGVIGSKKFVYDLWGDTVNIASRMESHGQPGRVHCSERVYEKIKNSFVFEDRGVIDVKGKGQMHTYFINEAAS